MSDIIDEIKVYDKTEAEYNEKLSHFDWLLTKLKNFENYLEQLN